MTKPLNLFSLVFICSLGLAQAEPLYTVNSSQLFGETLYAQSLNETGLIAVKPSISINASGDTDVLNQCLWSIQVIMADGKVDYAPGKMVCIGPNQEVLESIPTGVIEPVGRCVQTDCKRYTISSNSRVTMNLTEPLAFKLQPRNER